MAVIDGEWVLPDNGCWGTQTQATFRTSRSSGVRYWAAITL